MKKVLYCCLIICLGVFSLCSNASGLEKNRIPIKKTTGGCGSNPTVTVACVDIPTPEELCPNSDYPYLYQMYCYRECPKGTYFIGKEKECLVRCPDGFFSIGQECKCRGYYHSEFGHYECHHCSEINAVWNEELEKCEGCSYHAHANAEKNICECDTGYTLNMDGFCTRDCGDNLFEAYGACYPCSFDGNLSGVEKLECSKCPNRKYVNGECILK